MTPEILFYGYIVAVGIAFAALSDFCARVTKSSNEALPAVLHTHWPLRAYKILFRLLGVLFVLYGTAMLSAILLARSAA